MNRQQRRAQTRAVERETRQASRFAEMIIARENARNSYVSKIEQNGITIAGLEAEYDKGWNAGFSAASDPMYRSMMAAVCLALQELYGWDCDQIVEVLRIMDQKVIYSLTSMELVEEVFKKLDLELIFHDPFDRIRKKGE